MEIISSIGVVASPFLIKVITDGAKKFVSVDWTSGQRNVALKVLVAIFSFLAVLGTAALSGAEVDAVSVSTLAETIVVFVASTGIYFWSKFRQVSTPEVVD